MLPTKPVTQDRIQLNELAEIVPDDSDTGETETDPESPLIVEDMVAQYAGVFPMDVAIIEALPAGVRFSSVETFGNSKWTVTGKITTHRSGGSEQLFFVKIANGEHGRLMLGGEFESSKMIHSIMPDFIPQPFGFGKFKAQRTPAATYFYLSAFIDMDVTTAPDPEEFMGRLAELHTTSRSPTGQFGFSVVTYDGNIPHTVKWESTWAAFFSNLLRGACAIDAANNEPWPELERATRQLIEVVVPRLLGSLRHKGGLDPIKPCLIHGDLWEGNRGIAKATNSSVVYDASSYFAHNEMEFGNWRSQLNTFFRLKKGDYMKAYKNHFPAAEPEDEFDDRNRLYSIKVAINYSAMERGNTGRVRRRTAYNNMCYLIDKYAPIEGIEKYDPKLDPYLTGEHFEVYS